MYWTNRQYGWTLGCVGMVFTSFTSIRISPQPMVHHEGVLDLGNCGEVVMLIFMYNSQHLNWMFLCILLVDYTHFYLYSFGSIPDLLHNQTEHRGTCDDEYGWPLCYRMLLFKEKIKVKHHRKEMISVSVLHSINHLILLQRDTHAFTLRSSLL